MADISANNKRIAKNTLYLYFRMFITLIVGLYTSRVVLQALGVDDYGIYNVVGGVVVMFTFINNSMTTSTQRFVTCALGEGNHDYLKMIFSTSVMIYVILAIGIIILSETIGLWFVYNKMQIPIDRFNATLWVYQISIATTVVGMMCIPYNSLIIAHERMNIFAYISILDVVGRLVIAFALTYAACDKLVLYALLILLVQFIVYLCYRLYCQKYFRESKFRFILVKKSIFKEVFSFSGWVMTGSFAVILYTQGLNILLNLFFGPAVNAARGIAVQVQTVVRNFCTNFQTAINPQIIKSYVHSDMIQLQKLVVLSSKFSFFLIFFLSLPVMLETTFLLKCWLGIVPVHTENFIRVILLTSMIIAISNPIIIALHATGHLKKFQLTESSLLLCIPVISYLLLKFTSVPPESVFIVHLCLEVCAQYVRARIILPYIEMNMGDYFKKVISPILKVLCISPIMPIVLFYFFPTDHALSVLIVLATAVISSLLTIYYLGCTKDEQLLVKKMLIQYIGKYININR